MITFLGYDFGIEWVKLWDPSLKHVLDALDKLDGDRSIPSRRGLELQRESAALSILSLEEESERVVVIYRGVLDQSDEPRVYKLNDPDIEIGESEEDLLCAISSSGHEEEVHLHETVSREIAKRIVEYFYLENTIPSDLRWTKVD